jgi:peptidyl-prolyl cis-trans isomerase B (cyclophilin B)
MNKTQVALLIKDMGVITLELDSDVAPKTVENFLNYVKEGFYDGTIFHRVIDGFMIQGGGFTEEFQLKSTKKPIDNEGKIGGLKNSYYSVAMARTSDPHSAASQFFINVVDNDFLNFSSSTPNGWGYVVFGRVISGQDVVDKIKVVKTARRGVHDDVPTTPVLIEKAVVTVKPTLTN